MAVTKVTGMMQTGTKGGDIPSAGTLVIDTDGDYFDVTGTTTITTMTVEAGRIFTLQFDGVVTLTHGGTLYLNGATNFTTEAFDHLTFLAVAANDVRQIGAGLKDGGSPVVSEYIAWQSVVTASTLTAVAGRGYPINTTSNTCTVTLPASASVGDTIKFVDYARNWGTNKLILNQNSLNFQGYTSPNPEYATTGQAVTITYMDATKGWLPTVDDDVTDEVPQTYTLDSLVVAGGGAGGNNDYCGGGGAGGYRNTYSSETSGGGGSSETALTVAAGVVLTITVGAGGASSASNPATDGADSTIVGTAISITSVGGGGGAAAAGTGVGAAGGSGGGGSIAAHDSSYYAGGVGTSNQGYAGGRGRGVAGSSAAGGGGGGAGAAGTDVSGNNGGNGGVGVSSAITTSGSGVFRGGGGGAPDNGADNASSGGNGGGGDGKQTGVDAGDANTGGGGGGLGSGNGGAGGSGVVILRMPDTGYSGTTTGSPTIDTSTSASETILIFNGDGSYTT